MTFADGWVCRVCWKPNRPEDPACYRCKTPREIDEAAADVERKARAEQPPAPEPVPDIVVALPVVIFRSYGKVWLRGGLGLLGFLALMAFSGVTDVGYLALTGSLAAALVVCGFVAGEVSDGMREREVWAFVVGMIISVGAVIGSATAFQILAPGLVDPNAVRWGSVLVFGGAAIAAAAGLVMLFVRRA